jgi:Protein of unknown function (DUF2384)
MQKLEVLQKEALDLGLEHFGTLLDRNSWLNTPNQEFGFVTPIELCSSLEGLKDLREILYYYILKKSMPKPSKLSLVEPVALINK